MIHLLDSLRPLRTRQSEGYELRLEINGCFLGRSPSGQAALVIPTRSGPESSGRKCGRLTLGFPSRVLFELPDKSWESTAAVLECEDDDVLPTFCALSADIIHKLAASTRAPTKREVSDALFSWEALLRTTRRLSTEEELGLWGELWLISQTADVSTSIQAWQGPAAGVVDFVGGGVGVECKTSLHRFRHQVSHSQLDRPVGDYEVFLLSIFVSEDPLAGKTLPDLIQSIAAMTNDAPAFEAKLLNVGYSRSDAALYQRRVAVVEAPRWFPIDVIPRVRTFDAGVSNIRYTVELREELACSLARGAELLAQVFSAATTP